jgi:hypothetical protein
MLEMLVVRNRGLAQAAAMQTEVLVELEDAEEEGADVEGVEMVQRVVVV